MDIKFEQFRTLSTHLLRVLDNVGSSEYVRNIRQHGAITTDVLFSLNEFLQGHSDSIYTFGSASEGTTTPGLQSDTDTLLCFNQLPMYENYEQREPNVNCLLIIHDDITPPGYVKLHYVGGANDDELALENALTNDINGMPVVPNGELIEAMTNDERNGPAGTTLQRPGFTDLDYVPAFRYSGWPSLAIEWLQRTRRFGFPSPTVEADFRPLGCFAVPVGHPTFGEKHLQWRLSFSLQERRIMLNLNEVQFKCYILMKMVKKNFIKPVVDGKSLTSYHCKTCLFYIMENTDTRQWTHEYLFACFVKCIHMLKIWVARGFIPNYFVPSENMWKGAKPTREKVVTILNNILLNYLSYVSTITCDNVGQLLLKNMYDFNQNNIKKEVDTVDYKCQENSSNAENLGETNHSKASPTLDRTVHLLHICAISQYVQHACEFIEFIGAANDLEDCIRGHRAVIRFLNNIEHVSKSVFQADEYVVESTGIILPFLHTSLGSQLAEAACIASEGVNKEGLINESVAHLTNGLHSDALSGRVKHAAVLFIREHFKECEQILQSLHIDLPNHVTSLGMRHEQRTGGQKHFKHANNTALIERIKDQKPTCSEVLQQSIATCVIFLPFESSLIPRDLKFEMHSSASTESPQNGLVMVDSKVYLYYLLYRVREKLGMVSDKIVPLVHLILIAETDSNLCHVATAYNLIGCICKDNGEYRTAFKCFLKSLLNETDQIASNAAKWHLGVLFCELITAGHLLQ